MPRGPSTKLAWKGSYRKSSKTYLRNYLKIYKKKKGRLEREKMIFCPYSSQNIP